MNIVWVVLEGVMSVLLFVIGVHALLIEGSWEKIIFFHTWVILTIAWRIERRLDKWNK